MQELRHKAYEALRKSERIFKTDMVYLAKGGFWFTLIQFVSGLTAFALSIAFAHFLAKDAYGNYKYVLALAGIIGTFSLTGLGTAIAQSVARGFDGSLKKSFRENLKWTIGSVVLMLAFSAYYFFKDNNLLGIAMLVAAAFSPILSSSALFGSFLNGKKDFKLLAWLTSFRNGFPALVLIGTLIVYPDPLVVIAAYFASHTLASYLSYRITLKLYKPSETSEDPEIMGYAKHLSLISVLNAIADQIDKVIVFQYVGAVELAVYSFATAIPLQLKGALKSVYHLALPKFANRETESLRSEITGKMFRFLLVLIPVVVVYIIAAPYIYKIFFPRYTDAILMSQVFSLSLLAFVSVIPSTFLQAQKIMGGLYGTNITFAIVKIAFLFAGVILWGVWGVVIARTAYEFVGIFIALAYSRKVKGSSAV